MAPIPVEQKFAFTKRCSTAIIRDPLIASPDSTVMAAIAQISSLRSSFTAPATPAPITAEEQMNDIRPMARLSCVVVVENERVIGILTKRDLVRLQAQSPNRAILRQVMTQPVITLRESACTDWPAVMHLLQQRHIRHLPILDDRDRLIGLVTQESLLHALNPLELYERIEVLEQMVTCLEAEKEALLEHRTSELERQVEARTAVLEAKAEREKVVTQIDTQIQSSLNLQTILNTTVEQVWQALGCDRVTIWRFEADWQSLVVAEATDSPLSLVGERLDNSWFTQEPTEIYRQGWIRVVPDIYAADLSASHREMLIRLQTRATIVAPLLCGDTLWGLLNASESRHVREWQPEDVELLQALSVQLAIALQQAATYERLQAELRTRQQAEARLRESEHRYASLVAAAPVGIFRTDAAGRCIYVNERWCQISGLQPEAAMGSGWLASLHPKDRGRIAAAWKQFICQDHPFQLEYCFQSPNGQVRWVYGQAVAEQDAHGRIIGYVSTITDISDRKQVEQQLQQLNQALEVTVEARTAELQEREARYRALVEVIPDLLIRMSADGVFLDIVIGDGKRFNPRRLQAGNNIHDVFSLEHAHKQMFYVQRALQTREVQFYDYELMLEGRPRWEESRIVALNDEEVLVIVRDITDRKHAEEKLQKTNEELIRVTRLKDQFLANMSHELRTPLNAILGMAEGLQEQVFGQLNNERQLKALQTIERSGSHLLELINDILDIAKIESGQMELDITSTAVSPLCRSSLAFIERQALAKRIQIKTEIPPNLPDLKVDVRRIRQVLINLLNNAVKFTPEGGCITLKVAGPQLLGTDKTVPGKTVQGSPQTHLTITIIDTGIGIAPEKLDLLFQPFVQIDSALNRKYQGTGLGLALVKRIVELHGGLVAAASEVGVGSCFTIELPCKVAGLSTSRPENHSRLSAEFRPHDPAAPPLILLSEDNEANISTVSNYLSAKGYQILLARNGQEAIALAQSKNPDLILMDIQMPGLDGLEAIQQIRLEPNLVNVPIIALTALAMTRDRESCLAAGANDYLSKPVKMKELVIAIQRLLTAL